jgi:AraC-like DNA-binding protein
MQRSDTMRAVDLAHHDVSTDRAATQQPAVGVDIRTPASRCPAGGWTRPHEDFRYGIAFIRTGAFRRRVNGVEHTVDPNTGYFRRPGETIEIAHFHDEAHEGTLIIVDPEAATPELAEIERASGAIAVTPRIALDHRLMTSAVQRAAHDEAEARALSLLGAALSQVRPSLARHTRRASDGARQRLVGQVCEQLYQSPNMSLVELARCVHYSPFHLSHVFHEEMGVTISGYRTRLRVQQVLRHLEEGVPDLNRVAADAGFADHSHMTRTVVAHLGVTPSALRDSLRRTSARVGAQPSRSVAGPPPSPSHDEHIV